MMWSVFLVTLHNVYKPSGEAFYVRQEILGKTQPALYSPSGAGQPSGDRTKFLSCFVSRLVGSKVAAVESLFYFGN